MTAPGTTLQQDLRDRLQEALCAIGHADFSGEVVQATDPRFGDYQTNAAMLLAKRARANPRELAGRLIAALRVADLAEPPEIAGAGFINFRILPGVLAARLRAALPDPRLGVPEAERKRRVVVDYSAPNVAKPMHVGHLRTNLIGDALIRVARFLGHDVVGDNHLGDWGTQFGKLIHGWKTILDPAALERDPIAELVRLYREINRRSEEDPATLEQCRAELVKLQQGDPENRAIWQRCIAESWRDFDAIYGLLDLHFDERLGESFYNDRLGPLVEELLAKGIAEPSEGAICIFFRDIPELADKPCLVRKSDGGFLYATTDLATIEHRVARWNPDAIWYVVGAPQSLHLRQVFATARRMGYTVELHHVAFGSILGEDRKVMRTRSGENVSLRSVLEEAVERAAKMVEAKNPDLPAAEREEIARAIGIGAVKYAELSQHRLTDYVFSWDRMLSLQGNTAPYLQNAYVRILSIFRKGGEASEAAPPAALELAAPEERSLAKRLVQYAEVLPAVLVDFRPNLLAAYLYDLATEFHLFYEACPVLKAEEPARATRLALCRQAARTLKHGLGLLGIRTPDRM